MNILLSNDDGYHAKGLLALSSVLREMAEITVVAPDRNRSGASNSLTLEAPLRIRRQGPGVYAVNGTPTDCVHVAITGFLDDDPDMVISGINHGANLGDDVLYSGTVAAAMEGRFLGLPAVAISLVSSRSTNMPAAARVAGDLVRMLRKSPLPPDSILNINVPDLSYEQLAGFKATRLGYRHRAEPVVRSTDPRGSTIYWVGPAGPEQDCGPGTDFNAISEGYVSVTPLQVDLTAHNEIADVATWLDSER
ncbi:MAG: 5'/3'-nucleotidase SurE [Gammaproteobacteria bacterium]|nr:5'/3'-nucleotidase SurE [Gammaproteobacteria bacterium]NNF59814.1 5'/3'-nucleotidase SurE [Gammaproteobacteria bacterium]NNM21312.1 5'/3'-nucleotidase SurE [Gammaproteobacteria bacterium]